MSLYSETKKIIEVIQNNDFYDRANFYVVEYENKTIKIIVKKNGRIKDSSRFDNINSVKEFIAIHNI